MSSRNTKSWSAVSVAKSAFETRESLRKAVDQLAKRAHAQRGLLPLGSSRFGQHNGVSDNTVRYVALNEGTPRTAFSPPFAFRFASREKHVIGLSARRCHVR